MPDSLPLATPPRTGMRGLSPDKTKAFGEVNANNRIPRARLLDAPPRDVARLLAQHGVGLAHYLDAQRWDAIAHAHQRWPLLWGRAPAQPGSAR